MLENLLPWLGHTSFFLSAVSFMMSSILWLRMFAIASAALGIVYNSSIALGFIGPANQELWNVVAWISLFLSINIVQSVLLII